MDETEFRYKLGEEYLPLNKVIVLEKTDELEEKFKTEEKLIASGEYTHFAVKVVKMEDFRVHACFYFSNKDGEVVCQRKTSRIKKEYQDAYYEESNKLEALEWKAIQITRNKLFEVIEKESLTENKKEDQKAIMKEEYEQKTKELSRSLKEYARKNQIWQTEPFDDIIIALDNSLTLKFVSDLMKKTKYTIIEK